jgi:glutathione S-transferase
LLALQVRGLRHAMRAGTLGRMIKVHHLDNSRSQRILWLLEELELSYEVVPYKRLPIGFAPPELKAVHPLGKAPVVDLDGQIIAESGAAVELIVQRYGAGRLAPEPSSSDYVRYIEWLHYPESSFALPSSMALFGRVFRVDNPGYQAYVQSQLDLHLGYIANTLAGKEFLIGTSLTAADIQLTFSLQAARRSKLLGPYAALETYVERMEARAAYQRGIDKGGPFSLGFG